MIIELNKTVSVKGVDCTHAEQLKVTETEVYYNIGIMDAENDSFKSIYGIMCDSKENAPFTPVDEITE